MWPSLSVSAAEPPLLQVQGRQWQPSPGQTHSLWRMWPHLGRSGQMQPMSQRFQLPCRGLYRHALLQRSVTLWGPISRNAESSWGYEKKGGRRCPVQRSAPSCNTCTALLDCTAEDIKCAPPSRGIAFPPGSEKGGVEMGAHLLATVMGTCC